MLKKLLLLLFLIKGVYADEYTIMSNNQKDIIQYAYIYGMKYDLSWTLAAIAFIESKGGKYQISVDGHDYGVMQINIKSALAREGLKDTPFMRSKLATRLITDMDYCLEHAVAEIQFWQNRYGADRYSRVWGSYNGGHKGNKSYAKKIIKTIAMLKKHLW